MKYIIHTDGGARGNPGRAAVGVVIEEAISNQPSAISRKIYDTKKLKAESGTLIAELYKTIGEATNNVAEYMGVIEALQYLKMKTVNFKMRNSEIREVQFFLDSTLVVNQLNGIFKIKDATLRGLMMQVRVLEQEVGGVITYTAVPREQNARADFLVNKALDEKG